MQMYDLLMLAVMGGAILFGLWKGLAWQVASLAAIVVSYLVAINFRGAIAGLISAEPPWNQFLAMFILFLGTSLTIWIAFGFVNRSIERMHLKSFDRQAGGLLGALKGTVLCILVTLFAVSLLGDGTRQSICTSRSGNYIAHAIANLDGIVPPEIDPYIDPYIERFNDAMEEHGGPEHGGPEHGGPWQFQVNQQDGDFNNPDAAPSAPWQNMNQGATGGGRWYPPSPWSTPSDGLPTNGFQTGPVERVGQLNTSAPFQPMLPGGETGGSQRQYYPNGNWQLIPPPNQSNPNSNLNSSWPLFDWQKAASDVIDAASKLGQDKR